MEIHQVAAYLAAGVFGAIAVLQLLLALGAPLGAAAWGGEHRVLPAKFRLGSLVAILLLGVAAWVVLARAGLVEPGAEATWVRIAIWVFAAYFMLNTAGNVTSKSKPERYIMTPATVIIVACLLWVAVS